MHLILALFLGVSAAAGIGVHGVVVVPYPASGIRTLPLSSFEKDLTITLEQKKILDMFREKVKDRLPHEYMKSDLYLVRWLRARNFKLNAAEKMLMANLRWREENKMDTINEENWADLQKNYPHYTNTVDREGKPILYFHPGAWNFRAIAQAGLGPRFRRFVTKSFEDSSIKVRELQEKYMNVSQGITIVNLEGYNIATHGCIQCMRIILTEVINFEKFYPGLVEKIVLINTPTVFQPFLQSARRLSSPATNKAMKIFGTNKTEWKTYLFKYVDKSQLPEALGGTVILNPDDHWKN